MPLTKNLVVLAAFVQGVAVVAADETSSSSSSGSSWSKSSGPSDNSLANDLLISLACFVGVVFIYRMILYCVQYVRHLTSLNNGTQRYFAVPNSNWAAIKSKILYAPLLRVRHNREFRLSSAINIGVLPTRFQTLFMIAIIAANVTLSVYSIPWSDPETSVLPLLRNRTGTLATVNLIPLVIISGRNNPMIKWLNIPYDSFSMMHRLFGRLVALEALAHTLCWVIAEVQKSGFKAVQASFTKSQFIYSGLIATILVITICIQASSPLRHAFYETFLHLHIALIIVIFAFLWIHLNGMSEQNYLLGAIGCWAFERITRVVTLLYRNIGRGGTKAKVEALPGDAMRVTFQVSRPWNFKPGQYFFVSIPSVGLWTSHPFSVAWSETADPFSTLASSISDTDEKGLVLSRQDVVALSKSTFSAVIRRRTGFTNDLWNKAEKAGAFDGNQLTLNAFIDGPYGLTRSLDSYGTVMLFAGGVGITHCVPYVRDLVAGYAQGTVAARRVVLVWIIQSPDHLEWIRPWMTKILAMEKRRDVLSIKLFITRPRSAKEVHSPSSTVQMFPGRPHVETLIAKECESQVGAMGVSVCGTGSLQDEVRRVCRVRGRWSNIDFIEESFSW